jgi:hypothetical protein
MSKVTWLGFTAAAVQVAMGVWLVREAHTAGGDDLVQCHEPVAVGGPEHASLQQGA